jgi:hypothetical protein
MRPYRCHHCDWRRWSRVRFRPGSEGQTVPDELRMSAPHGTVHGAELDRLDPK